MKVIMKCVNIKLWDLLGCFHYILNAPRTDFQGTLQGRSRWNFATECLFKEETFFKVIWYQMIRNK